MSWFVGWLPFCKVMAVFVVMIVGIRLRLDLGATILGGSILLALFFGLGAGKWAECVWCGVSDLNTFLLVVVVGLIMVLGEIMEKSGQSIRFVNCLSKFIKWPRLRLILFPSLIGLLPMPGGAIFSAPMVKNACRGMDLTAEHKAIINYWFRHVWENSWPLYPGVIMAMYVAQFPLDQYLFLIWPSVLLCLVLGWFCYLRPGVLPETGAKSSERDGKGGIIEALREGLPLIWAISCSVFSEGLIEAFGLDLPHGAGLVFALTGSIIMSFYQNRLSLAVLGKIALGKHLMQMLFLVISILIFKEVLEEGGVIESISGSAPNHSTLFFLTLFFPLIVGFITGLTLAYVGSCLPLILGLADLLGLESQRMAFVVLTMFSGFTGILISPLHACLLLTTQYFGASLGSVWRKTIVPGLVIWLFGAIYFAFLSAIS